MLRLTGRWRWLPAVVPILAMCVTLGASLATPNAARAAPSTIHVNCNTLTDPAARASCKKHGGVAHSVGGVGVGLPNPVTTVTGIAGSVADSAVRAVVHPILQGVAGAEADAVSSVLSDEIKFINNSGSPTITAGWFVREYALVLGGVLIVGLVGFFFRLTRGTVTLNVREAGAAIISLPVFLWAIPILPALTGVVTAVCDKQVSAGLLNAFGKNTSTTLHHLTVGLGNGSLIGSFAAILLPVIFLFIGVMGGILTEIMLVLRNGILEAAVVATLVSFGLFMFGGWAEGFFKRSLLTLIATILVKPMMALSLVISIGLIGSSGGAQPFIQGAAGLILTPVLVFMGWKAISGMNFSVGNAVQNARGLLRT